MTLDPEYEPFMTKLPDGWPGLLASAKKLNTAVSWPPPLAVMLSVSPVPPWKQV